MESIELLSQLFSKDILDLFCTCLTTSYFLLDGKFEHLILDTASLKPKVWYRYVNNIFVIWSHGEEELKVFLKHINSVNKNIQFTMEMEQDGELPFFRCISNTRRTMAGTQDI